MVNRITRILALAAFCAAPGAVAFAQAYAVDGPVPAYPPETYRAQDADGGYAVRAAGPSQAQYAQPYRDRDGSDRGRYDQDGYDQGSRREQPQGRALEDQRAQRQAPAYQGAYRQESGRRVERLEASYRFLSWAGKVEDSGVDRGAEAYASSQGYAGPSCPGVRPGERVLNCQYVPFAPPPERESDVQMANLYIDGGVGPSVIGGGGGGGGGPSNGQVTLGTGFSGVTAPTFSGGGSNGGGSSPGSGSGSGNGSGSGSGTGVGTGSGSGIGSATSSSSSSSSASASVSANISANITLAVGFFIHGGGGHGGGGKKGGGSSCGCGSSGGGGMTGWGGSGGSGGGGMSGWSGGGHKK